MDEVLVAKQYDESLFYVFGEPGELDGRVERDGKSFDVPFWSYVSRMEVEPLRTTAFHRSLWDKNGADDPAWMDRFVNAAAPFTEEEVAALDEIGVKVPESRRPKEADEKPAGDAKKPTP